MMEATQSLVFVEFEKAPVVPVKADYMPRGSLQYEFATEILQTPIQLTKISNAPAQIKEVLKHLVENNVAMVRDDAPLKFVQLVQFLRAATLKDTEAIWAQFKDKPVYRRWLLDTLPAVATPVVLKFIKEKFLAGEFTLTEFIPTLVVALQMVPADLETIQWTASLALHEKIATIPALREVVMLGYGSMIAKYCVAVPTCPAELLRPIHEIATEAISKNDIPEITLALKVLGNAGHPSSLKPIMKLLPVLKTTASALPIGVQVDAILALRSIAKKEPKLVQPVALQLVLERALHPELRMVACILLFETKPSVAAMSSSRWSKTLTKMEAFRKFHKDQYKTHHGDSKSSRSTGSSLEQIQKQSRYLGNTVPPVFAIIARAVRVDRKLLGYQFVAFFDKPSSRVQLIASSIAENDNFKFCADGVLLSKHKVTSKVTWGAECKEYAVTTKAEAGLLGEFPAFRLEWEWERLPIIFTTYAKKLSKHIPMAALQAGFNVERAKNSEKELELTVALPSKRTLNVIVRVPEMTMSRMDIPLPVTVPINPDGTFDVHFYEDIYFRAQNYIYDYTTAQCSMMQDTISTFNNKTYKNEMPISCYQVLAQDCTSELKFVALLKKDEESEKTHLNVKLVDIDIDLYTLGTDAKVKINGLEVPISSLPYQHPSGSIQIREKADGLSLYAPSLGLHEVYFANGDWKIQVADWMKGQTCGLCGKADGEIKQEYTTPSGYLTESSVSFAHSWVLPAESCRNASQCRMKLESVKFEKQVILNGQESKCYSVEPVLRCLPGCAPVRTTPVTVGYHCMSTASNLNMLAGIYEKSVDLRETTDAHVVCRCTEQCA
uniref:Vtg2 protein n=1 Tax=Danio rerio TaxID=7955 RepID=A8WGJ1_DANRE|nr:Vtg2 protein [Danio rerio]|eukprot:NP_001103854.1 vitellogenin 2 isoform 2 [Danio rerio]